MIKDILQQNENLDPNDKQLSVLREHFPACFAPDGSFDLQRFKEEIADKTNLLQEGYELRFLGKSYAKLIASTETTTVIQPNEAHNSLPENNQSENIYISGDNLDGLKHLLKSYNGKIKCIYIDPPYNTGSDGFVYQDKFNYTKETLQEKLSVSEEEAERILDLTKRGSASHSAWLMFMYSRLILARDLLDKDGVIFISIDDNEQSNLKLLCDDVFGEESFLSTIIWKKRSSPDARATIGSIHDYILCYLRVRENAKISISKMPLGLKRIASFSNPDNDPRGPWASVDMTGMTGRATKDQYFEVQLPSGRRITPPKGRSWGLAEATFKDLLKDKRIWFGVTGDSVPRIKNFLSESDGQVVPSFWDIEVGSNDEGSKELFDLFEAPNIFDSPKPVSLVKRILEISSNANDTILDFFSGSATTAHAVMDLNSSEEQSKRKFIAVQLPEVLSPDVESQKNAYQFLKQNNLPSTLDYVGMERIKRAATKIKDEHPEKELDLGFRHYILAEPVQNTLDKLESFDKAGMLADTTILDDFGKPTVLATWLNADGYGLTAEAQAVDLAGYTAYHYKKHLYLIDGGFSLESMKALIQKYDAEGGFNPENLVLFGYSFPDWSINEMIEKNLRVLNDSEKNLKINYSVRY